MLLIFGDSWPYGSELQPNELPYGQLLANKTGHDVLSFARPSTSIPHLVLQLKSAMAIEFDTATAVFFLTGVDRDLTWVDGTPKELHPTCHDDVDWYLKYSSPELSSYRVNTTLIALQSMCAKRNILDYYIWGWDQVELWPEVDASRIYNQTMADVFLEGADIPPRTNKIMHLKNSKNQYIWPNQGHPNQLGHHRIASLLQDWICT